MKKIIIILCIVFALLAGGGLVGAFYVTTNYWRSLLMSLSVAFIQLVIGVLIVNIYLDSKGKQNIAIAFLNSSGNRIVAYHNTFLGLMWKEFGQRKWGEIVDAYIHGGGKPEIIAADVQKRVCAIVLNNYSSIKDVLFSAGEQMDEIAKSGILTFDENVHSHAWDAKEAAKKFLKIDISQSNYNISDIFECCVDFDIHTQLLKSALQELANKR